MGDIELAEDAVKVDAAVIATDLGLRPEGVLSALRDGRLTAVCEHGGGAGLGSVAAHVLSQRPATPAHR